MPESGRTESAYDAIARLVSEHTGWLFGPTRRDDAESGIRRAMSKASVADPVDYLELLTSRADALDALIAELTVGETYVLRDSTQFDFIRRVVLPGLQAVRGPEHVLRVWSAGCASGEEAYSLAIALDQCGMLGRAQIVGTDISRPSLARAAAGTYGPWSLRGVSDQVLARYFQSVAGRQVVDGRIKNAVSFRYLNLAQDVYPALMSGIWNMDLVVCRNVLIYFDRQTVTDVAARLFESLAPGGWLVAGATDPSLSELAALETVVTREGVFYRRGPHGSRWGQAPEVLPGEPAPAAPPSSAPVPVTCEPDATTTDASVARSSDAIARARDALAAGNYDAALQYAHAAVGPAADEVAIKASASRDGSEAAVALAARATKSHPLSPELQFLYALLLLDVGRLDEATRALKRVIYLDSSLALAHFVLGTVLRCRGHDAARRSFETAAALAGARAPDEVIRLGDGERAGQLAAAARMQAAIVAQERGA
jgi:chemotaxis protein methyltransferase CheR